MSFLGIQLAIWLGGMVVAFVQFGLLGTGGFGGLYAGVMALCHRFAPLRFTCGQA